jgi:hypothetical protein
MAVRTATNENRQAAAEGQENVREPLRPPTLGIMASRIRKHRKTRLKGYRLMFRRDIRGEPDRLNPRPDTRCAGRSAASAQRDRYLGLPAGHALHGSLRAYGVTLGMPVPQPAYRAFRVTRASRRATPHDPPNQL